MIVIDRQSLCSPPQPTKPTKSPSRKRMHPFSSPYLGKGAVGSSYGAAGSLIVVLVWVYYSSRILLFGAEFTEVYSRHRAATLKR